MSDSGRDWEIGYRKPPRGTQFKPGVSGNPRGRPRRSRDIAVLLDRQLDRVVTVTRDNRPVRITMRELLITSVVKAGINGDARARDLIFKHMQESGRPEPVSPKDYDARILDEVARAVIPSLDDIGAVE